MTNSLVPVSFHGATLATSTIDGVPYVAMRPICEAIGLDWTAQLQRIKRHPVLARGVVVITVPSASGDQLTTMLPLNKLNGWLFGVSANRVAPEIRDKLIAYQTECFEVLAKHFMPEVPAAKINPAQAQHLRELVQLVVETGKQTHGETWNRLHRKMKVNSYHELAPSQFDEACDYLRSKMDDSSIAAIAQKHFPQSAALAAPAVQVPSLDAKTLCSMIQGGLIDQNAMAEITFAAAQRQFVSACETANTHKEYGEEVASRITSDLSWANLNKINIAASMEVWRRCKTTQTPPASTVDQALRRIHMALKTAS